MRRTLLAPWSMWGWSIVATLVAGGCGNVGWDGDDDIGPPGDDDDDDTGSDDDDDDTGGADDDDDATGDDDDSTGDDDDSTGDDDDFSNDCTTAINLGVVPDDGSSVSAGECLDYDEWIWYSFIAGDDVMEDEANHGDRWGVYVVMPQNEDDWFLLQVFQGDCSTTACPGNPEFDTYSNSMDQDPCGGPGQQDCEDNTTTFLVKVYSNMPTGTHCRNFSLQITNG